MTGCTVNIYAPRLLHRDEDMVDNPRLRTSAFTTVRRLPQIDYVCSLKLGSDILAIKLILYRIKALGSAAKHDDSHFAKEEYTMS